MFCPACGTREPEDARFCVSCGQRLPEMPVQHGGPMPPVATATAASAPAQLQPTRAPAMPPAMRHRSTASVVGYLLGFLVTMAGGTLIATIVFSAGAGSGAVY